MKMQWKTLQSWLAIGFISVVLGVMSNNTLAQTAAGSEIKNAATVSYQDAAGNIYNTPSNDAVVTVQQVFSSTLSGDNNKSAIAGISVSMSHVLTNRGNGPETYTITYSDGVPAADGRPTTRSPRPGTLEVSPDVNSNGIRDAGELPIASNGEITLNPGESINLVLEFAIPTLATPGVDTLGVTLTVQAHRGLGAPQAGFVTDTGANNDSANDTNVDYVTVTNDAVIDVTKSSTHLPGLGFTETSFGIDVDNDPGTDHPVELIKYEIVVENNGNSNAQNVTIFDGLPTGTHLIQNQSGVTAVYNIDSTNFFATAPNLDTLPTYANALDDEASHSVDLDQDNTTDSGEGAIAGGIDLNSDGDSTDSNIPGLYAVDSQLMPNRTSTITFYVAYAPTLIEGGTVITNSAFVCSDLNGNGNTNDPGECGDVANPPPSTSNSSAITTETTVGVSISDTGALSTSGLGGDDDLTTDGTQTVNEASTGSEFYIYSKITNTGNKIDIFDIVTPSAGDPDNSFPPGTTFTYFNSGGSGQLSDSNSNSVTDTGPIPSTVCLYAGLPAPQPVDGFTLACNEKLIRILVRLPADAHNFISAGNPFTATTTVTSVNDPAISNNVDVTLLAVTEPTVDIAAQAFSAIDSTTNTDGINIGNGVDATDFASAAIFNDAGFGVVLSATLYIANEGGSADSYTIETAGSYNGATWDSNPLSNWSFVFKDAGIDTNLDGNANTTVTNAVVTQTPSIPGGAAQILTLEITVPLDVIYALADANDGAFPLDVGEQENVIDVNGDTDNDYIISVVVTSNNSGADDRLLLAFDFLTSANVEYAPLALSQQIQRGRSAIFDHTLKNTGNSTEYITLRSSNDKESDGFGNLLTIIDDTGTEVAVGTLCSSGTTSIDVDPLNGEPAFTVEVDCDDAADLEPDIQLKPGEMVPLKNTVFAPRNASEGVINKTSLTAEIESNTAISSVAEDDSVVIAGNLSLYKYIATDSNCDGEADSVGGFLRTQTSSVPPGECFITKLVLLNIGSDNALNIEVKNEIPLFGTLINDPGFVFYGILQSCRNFVTPPVGDSDQNYPLTSENIGALCQPTDSTSTDAGNITQSVVGDDIVYEIDVLEPNDVVVMHFTTKVD